VFFGLGSACALVGFASDCQVVAGVDFDKAHLAEPDGGGAVVGPSQDGSTGEGGGIDGDGGNGTSTCTPDPSSIVCADKCGPTEDNCKTTRSCSTNCGEGRNCVNGKCECVSNGQWCLNRCGQANDNCGRPVQCGGCDGGVCSMVGTCGGCVPDSLATTCGTKNCGVATNNCGQFVACGKSGQCSTPGAICNADGSCCTDNGTACDGKCGGVVVTNNCGPNIGCPAQCPAGQACQGTTCCNPEPLATTCAGVACGLKVNNCGQTILCPSTCISPNVCGGGGGGPNACGCTPIDTCGSRCSGTVTDNCGNTITCKADCSIGGECPCAGGSCKGSFCFCKSPPCF
jgi:hypothetical protein